MNGAAKVLSCLPWVVLFCHSAGGYLREEKHSPIKRSVHADNCPGCFMVSSAVDDTHQAAFYKPPPTDLIVVVHACAESMQPDA